ncbi:presenilins-associated rhomboid-like protein, mitochondrial [Branchiostoma floridae]|uniref:rhomboid protease n=1 Tax=Branchiostoma floridae TaxID=7739 RepID=A0A9J7N5M5_BRAFL|nr:presenilins-associated rhomboid-like protein, mitochondrial [Branchiostoma floridae]
MPCAGSVTSPVRLCVGMSAMFRKAVRGFLGPRNRLDLQQQFGFRRAPKKEDPPQLKSQKKKEADSVSDRHVEQQQSLQKSGLSPEFDYHTLQTVPYSRLFKPFCFAIGFSGVSFVGASIWQYENLRVLTRRLIGLDGDFFRDRIHPPKTGQWRREINKFWQNLTEGQKVVSVIIGLNGLVYALWRIPQCGPTMLKYFTSNIASTAICLPMVLSTFSHYSFLHYAVNMYVLWSFSTSAVAILGKEQFTAFYLTAGVLSNLASYAAKVGFQRFGPSLGASGAIMGVLGLVCTQVPEAQLAIVFFPFVTFTAGSAIKVIMGLDAAGVLLGWRFFDHAAHLGGALCGIWYMLYGHKQIWQNREPVMRAWHKLRDPQQPPPKS